MNLPLKWPGGKSKLIPKYQKIYSGLKADSFNCLYEGFFGGGALFFRLRPEKAVLSDKNAQLINLYVQIRDDVEGLIQVLSGYQEQFYQAIADGRASECYESIRSSEPSPPGQCSLFELTSPVEQAARLVFLNRAGFNGLMRWNSHGKFNTPIGRTSKGTPPAICQPDVLRSAHEALAKPGVQILYADFADTVGEAKPGDLVFLDPPYYPLSPTADFVDYGPNSTWDSIRDNVRVKEVFQSLVNQNTGVLASNSNTDFIRNLYQEFEMHEIPVSRSINSDTEGRKAITELLIVGRYAAGRSQTCA